MLLLIVHLDCAELLKSKLGRELALDYSASLFFLDSVDK